MWRHWRVLGVMAAVLLAMFAVTAALPGPYAGFAMDDVRRPVYRGNIRYKRYFYNLSVHKNNENRLNDNLLYHLNSLSRQKRDTNNSVSIKSTPNSTLSNRKVKKISTYTSIDSDENWSLVSLATSISDQNHTRSLVRNFLSNSLQHLQTSSFITPVKGSTIIKSGESLDNLILSHTHHAAKPIQMYPEGSPPNWYTNPVDPSVILIEDVHPSKLPKPTTQLSHHADESWNQPTSMITNKPLHNMYYKPVQMYPIKVQKRPKPTIKPIYNWENIGSVSGNPEDKPQESYTGTGVIQPVLLQSRPTTFKPPSKLKPYVVKPLHHYTGSVAEISQSSVDQSHVANIPVHSYTNNNNHWNDPPVYKPPYNLVRPTRPVYHDPPTTEPHGPSSEPVYRPVYTFPRPTKPSESKPPYSSPRPPEGHYNDPPYSSPRPPGVYYHDPPHSSPRPPEVHYHDPSHGSPRPPGVHYHDPPHTHNSSKHPSVVITQTTVLPVTEPTLRPPPPSIIVIDSISDVSSPPPSNDCGNIQVINHFSKEPQYGCSDVMILVNSPVVNSASSSAAVGGGGGSSVAETLGGIAAVSHSVALAAGAAAASGAAGAAAAAAGAAAAGAAGSAGAAAAGSAGAAAAAAAAAAAGVAGSGASVVPPAVAPPAIVPPAAVPPASSPPHVTPVIHPLDDEEDYDYEDEPITSDPPKPMKPSLKPPSLGHVITFLDYVNAFINTLPIIGPVSVSLWIILLGPVIFLLVGLMGVGTFLLPWVAPSIILGRRRKRSILGYYPKITQSAITFERNLKLGLLDNYYKNLY